MSRQSIAMASLLLLAASPVAVQAAVPKVQIATPWDQEIAVPVGTSAPVSVSPARLTPVDKATFAAMKAQAANAPAAAAATKLAVPDGPQPLTSDVTVSFTGLDRPSAANNGAVFFPPDTIVAKSPTRVLEAVNSAVRLFTTAGGNLGTSDLNTFFGALVADGLLFDPKVYYDRNAANPRMYAVALQRNSVTGVARLWLAISRAPDPAGLAAANWCRYAISTVRNPGTADASWGDYPGLGAGATDIVVSLNNFRFSNNTFTYAIVRTINKVVANNNAAACPALPFRTYQASAALGDGSAFTLQPAQSYTSPSSFVNTTNPAYLVSTIFGNNNQYRLWRLANQWAGVGPKFEVVNAAGAFAYSLQPDANQFGSASLLDTGDNRMMQVAGIGNGLQAVHATGCNFSGGAAESCVRQVRVIAGQNVAGDRRRRSLALSSSPSAVVRAPSTSGQGSPQTP